MQKYYAENPPLHLMVKHYLGYGSQPTPEAPPATDEETHQNLMTLLAQQGVQIRHG